jgi:G3E family GTPase
VDAVNGMDTLDRQFEAVKQVAVADHLLLTKADLADTDAVERIERRLRAFNPSATITRVPQGAVDPGILDAGFYDPATKAHDVRNWLGAEAFDDAAREHSHHDHADHGHDAPHHADHDHAKHDVNRHDERVRAVCLTYDKPVTRLLFDLWLDILMHVKGPDLLRVKGIVRIADLAGPLVIHCVQHVFHPPLLLGAWPSDDRRTRLVIITRDIDAAWLRNTLTLFETGDGAAMQLAPVAEPPGA